MYFKHAFTSMYQFVKHEVDFHCYIIRWNVIRLQKNYLIKIVPYLILQYISIICKLRIKM